MKEESIMKNNIEEEESAVMGQAAVTGITNRSIDYASMVPEDEKALSDRPTVSEIEDMHLDYASMVPENERAETEKDELGSLLKEIESEVFSPVKNMKGFQTDTGYRIYARICENSKDERLVEYVQQYSDGTFSEKMSMLQSDLFIAAAYRFISKDIPEPKLKNKVSTFMVNTLRDYTGKITRPGEQMDIIQILNIIIQNYQKLPCDQETKTNTPIQLYKTVIKHIMEIGMGLLDEHETYYTIFDEQMEEIAQKMGMKRLDLLRKLNDYGFLYLQGSSEGYQIKVRFQPDDEFFRSPHAEWCYGIYKPEFLAKCGKKLKQS